MPILHASLRLHSGSGGRNREELRAFVFADRYQLNNKLTVILLLVTCFIHWKGYPSRVHSVFLPAETLKRSSARCNTKIRIFSMSKHLTDSAPGCADSSSLLVYVDRFCIPAGAGRFVGQIPLFTAPFAGVLIDRWNVCHLIITQVLAMVHGVFY